MNRIVEPHVTVAELPEHLRELLDLAAFATVEVTLETQTVAPDEPVNSVEHLCGLRDKAQRRPPTGAILFLMRSTS